MKEMMLLGLRLLLGVSAQRFYHRFGVGLEDVFGPVRSSDDTARSLGI